MSEVRAGEASSNALGDDGVCSPRSMGIETGKDCRTLHGARIAPATAGRVHRVAVSNWLASHKTLYLRDNGVCVSGMTVERIEARTLDAAVATPAFGLRGNKASNCMP